MIEKSKLREALAEVLVQLVDLDESDAEEVADSVVEKMDEEGAFDVTGDE
jgi:hypothetical protein